MFNRNVFRILNVFELLKIHFFIVFLIVSSCKKDDLTIVKPEVPENQENLKGLFSEGLFIDTGSINIRTTANANSWDSYLSSLLQDISGDKFAYCHPDVEYFENSFNGFKYWMAFTPYFGSVGSLNQAILYENPTIVVSNDGINWQDPPQLINPLQLRPSLQDGVVRNSETIQGYWSDTDLLYKDGRLNVFYRGSIISKTSLQRIVASSKNNDQKLLKNAVRTIVKQQSEDGVNWSPIEILYTSNEPETLNDNDVLSPSFVSPDGHGLVSYEVLFNKGKEGYRDDDDSFVLKRTSTNELDFSSFTNSKIVRFENKPWKKTTRDYSPWHLQASYVDGYYFLYLAVGRVKSFISDDLYIAYSKDGSNFKVYPQPIVKGTAYRSCIFPIKTSDSIIEFGSVIGLKSGRFKFRKFNVSKVKLNKLFS